jgi:ABC-type glycerol-3-phosphate transport system substrate-binding protein
MLNLFRSCFFAALALLLIQPAQAATTIELWHAMSGALNERVDELADKFNKSRASMSSNPSSRAATTTSSTA